MTATTPAPVAPERRRNRGRRAPAALAGLLAAAVALGAAELVAGVVGPASSPVVAVGDAVIPLTPEPVKRVAIAIFGQHDKTALVTGTLVLLALYALAVGVLGLRSRQGGVAGVAVFGILGAVAALSRPAGGVLDALPSLLGAVAGAAALLALLRRLDPPPVADDGDAEVPDRAAAVVDRRRFVLASGVAVGTAVVTGGGGRLLQRRFDVAEARSALPLPAPASPAPPLPAGADLAPGVPGLTPLVTANRDFYRIDTALTVPQIRPTSYRLSLTGMFDEPRTWTLAELLDRDDVVERDATLTCVSNEVGGTLTGTARWTGVPLGAFLREAGVQPGSTQLVCRSEDGMTIGAPTRAALDTGSAMLAFGMNGEPLPVEHGFPVRMVIPGLYGYVSACKWLTAIEASTFEAFDAYWVQRGWAQQGPIKTGSRIDTPASARAFPAGRRPIAGVAWAQGRGISRVEVRVDGGDWQETRLNPADDADIWRQWVLPFDFSPGSHLITVRATDGTGQLQTGERADPVPDGASGWHAVRVLVN